MGRQPNFGTPIAFGLILAALVMGYFDYRSDSSENAAQRTISVTGIASQSVEADRAVWKGRMLNESSSLQRGYQSVQTDREVLEEFLKERGIDSSRIEFEPVQVQAHSTAGRTSRYTVEQGFMLRGEDLEAIEACSKEASSLMQRGVRIRTQSPRYFHSELESLRKDLNARAAAAAKKKAEAVADSSGVALDDLQKLKEKQFHVEGTDPEEGSAPGYEYTRSPEQTLEVVVKAKYRID